MPKLSISLLLLMFVLIGSCLAPTSLLAQGELQPTLEKLTQFSTETGFPIFAIASGDNCPACQQLKKTIEIDTDIKQSLEKFLILRLDVESKEYLEWIRQHPTSGQQIPQLFIVRSDSRELLNRVGSMETDELRKAIKAGLSSAGRPISSDDSAIITKLADELVQLHQAGKLIEASELASKSTDSLRLAINSYASSAVELREILSRIQVDLETLIRDHQKQLKGWSNLSEDARTNQIATTVETINRLEGIKVAGKLLPELKQTAQSIPEIQSALTDKKP